MRSIFFIALALCLSASMAKFLPLPSGMFQQIDLQHPPQELIKTLSYLSTNLYKTCKLDNRVVFTHIQSASSQVVAGTNYEITYIVKNYQRQVLTVQVFQSLPTENDTFTYEIKSCY